MAPCRDYHYYIAGRKFYVHTDHLALKWLVKQAESSEQLLRWVLCLQGYDYEVIYRAGTKHQNTDGLSRVGSQANGTEIQLGGMDTYGIVDEGHRLH